MLQDRRKFLRFDVPLHVKFKPSKDKLERYVFGTTINFSRNGFCFEVQNIDLKPAESLEFRVMLPSEDAFVPVLGDIVWKKQVDSNSLFGIKFIAMNKDAKWEILDHGYSLWLDKMQGKNMLRKVACYS